jgi:hypothetical protein
MVAQATALVVVCIAYLFANLPRAAIDGADDDEDNYVRVPRAVVDVERQANVDKIYNCTDIESVNILRMRKAPFFSWLTYLERGTSWRTTLTLLWRNK